MGCIISSKMEVIKKKYYIFAYLKNKKNYLFFRIVISYNEESTVSISTSPSSRESIKLVDFLRKKMENEKKEIESQIILFNVSRFLQKKDFVSVKNKLDFLLKEKLIFFYKETEEGINFCISSLDMLYNFRIKSMLNEYYYNEAIDKSFLREKIEKGFIKLNPKFNEFKMFQTFLIVMNFLMKNLYLIKQIKKYLK